MTKRIKNSLMGIVLIGLAVLLIASQVGYNILPAGLGGLRILYLAGCAVILIEGIMDRNFWTIGLGAGLGYWVLEGPMNWPHLSIWTLALAWILVSMGFEMIFRKKKHGRIWARDEDWEHVKNEGVFEDGEHNYRTGEEVCKDAVFSSVTRYVQDRDFRGGSMDVVFSSVQMYFDQAALHDNRAVLNMDVVFSHVTIYVPKEWDVVDNMSHIMCGRGDGDCLGQGTQTLVLEGDCVFGGVKVQRV
ncbi:MAG: hypothetical protein E7280_08290 [Lachnospiraceae bacterium]|nr:hypothetical protein [Lachnospiraceae bacterium]